MTRNGLVSASIALAASSPAASLAQQPSGCTLHVWPGSRLGSIYYGWTHGARTNGAVDGLKNYPTVPAEAVGTREQAELLSTADLPGLLRRPDLAVSIHDDALDSMTIRRTPGRIAPASGCYAELIVDDVMLRQDTFHGSKLMTLIRFRDFGDNAAPARTFATWVMSPLKGVPVEGAVDESAARAEFRAAFSRNLALFGTALARSRDRH